MAPLERPMLLILSLHHGHIPSETGDSPKETVNWSWFPKRVLCLPIYTNTISAKTSVVFQASAKANHFLTRSFDSGFDGFDEDLKEELELP